MNRLDTKLLARAVRELCAKEPRFNAVVAAHGLPSLRESTRGLASLLSTVNEQFLSLAAGAAIWQRVEARLGTCAPATILACSEDELMALGLSRAKAKSFHAIATAAEAGLDLEDLSRLDDDNARKILVSLRGVGPWTADIYLLSVELRPNVWPSGDLALQASAQNLFSLRKRPDRKKMETLGNRFAPWRAVAARLLWSHYRSLKGMKQA